MGLNSLRAATYYVNDATTIGEPGAWCTAIGANGAGRGGTTNPFLTLAGCLQFITTLTANDTIRIDYGTYSWAGISWYLRNRYGTAAGQLTIQGHGSTGTNLTDITCSSGILFNFPWQTSTKNQYITFQDMKLTSAAANKVFYFDKSNYNIVKNCIININGAGMGIHIDSSASNITISGNTITSTGSTVTYGIFFDHSTSLGNITITQNKIYPAGGTTTGTGISWTLGSSGILTVTNNYISNFKYGITGQQAVGAGSVINNNSFYCQQRCLDLTAASNLTIKNNIFYVYGGVATYYCVYMSDASSPPLDYNLYYYTGLSKCAYRNTIPYAALTNWKNVYSSNDNNSPTAANPNYTSPTTGNLSIVTGSPAENKGTSSGTPTIDIFGSTRSSPPEIGAFEIMPVLLVDAGNAQSTCLNGTNITTGGSPTATGGSGTYTSYMWSSSAGAPAVSGNIANPIISPTATGIYTYTVTVTDNTSATASDNVVITINALPLADAGSNVTGCNQGSKTLTATGGGTYLWNTLETTATINVAPAVTTTYTVIVTNTNNCSASDFVVVTIVSPPTASAGSPQSICSGAPFTLGGSPTATGGTTPYTYAWLSNPAGFASTDENPSTSLTTTTTYTLTVTDKNGCTASSNVVKTLTNIAAAPTVGSNSPLTLGATLNLTCSSASSWIWAGPNSFSSILQNPSVTNVQPVNAGAYTVTITDAYGCINSGTVNVLIGSGNIYYVNDNSTSGDTWCTAVGNDANNGTSPSTPKLTLQSVLTDYTLTADDYVLIDKGIYSWAQITFNGTDHGTSSGQLIIQGAGAAKTVITGTGADVFNCQGPNGSYITFKDMTCNASASGNDAFYLGASGGSCTNIQILNCTISSSRTNVIYLFNNVSYLTLSGNTINFTGSNAAINFYQPEAGNNITITYNKINGVNGSEPNSAIYASSYFPSCTIKNNFISYFVNGFNMVHTGGTTNMYNNSFYCKTACLSNATSGGECCYSGSIKNNIFYVYGSSGGGFCIDFGSQTTNTPLCDYNLYYYPNGNYCAQRGVLTLPTIYATLTNWKNVGGYSHDGASLTGDPNFISATTFDLHLNAGSPAIDKGVTLAAVPDDIDYGPRPFLSAAYDMGADEVGSVLPVELVSSSAFCKQGTVHICWTTASETDNDYFEIEKSNNGFDFISVAQIKGAGNSHHFINYIYNDPVLNSEEYYYRLKQIDFNGKQHQLNVFHPVCNDQSENTYKIYYSEKNLYLSVYGSETENLSIHVYDMTGRMVINEYKSFNENSMNFRIPTERFSPGFYLLHVLSERSTFKQKIYIY